MSDHSSAVQLARSRAEQDATDLNQVNNLSSNDTFLEDMSSIGIKSKPNRGMSADAHIALEDHDITLGRNYQIQHEDNRTGGVCSTVTSWAASLFAILTFQSASLQKEDGHTEREMTDFHKDPDQINRMTTINSTKNAENADISQPTRDQLSPTDVAGTDRPLAVAEHSSSAQNLVDDIPQTNSLALP